MYDCAAAAIQGGQQYAPTSFIDTRQNARLPDPSYSIVRLLKLCVPFAITIMSSLDTQTQRCATDCL
jgi:hypothetical protein